MKRFHCAQTNFRSSIYQMDSMILTVLVHFYSNESLSFHHLSIINITHNNNHDVQYFETSLLFNRTKANSN